MIMQVMADIKTLIIETKLLNFKFLSSATMTPMVKESFKGSQDESFYGRVMYS